MSSTLKLVSLIAVLCFSAINCDVDFDPQCDAQMDVGEAPMWPFAGSPGTYYYWNISTRQCEPFEYKGWFGNENRYATKEECRTKCDKVLARTREAVYKKACNANASNFVRLLKCKLGTACSAFEDRNPECYQTLDIGQWCGQTVPLQQYYFDPGTGVCHPFQWNRCGGNENRFETYEKCMERCDPLTHPKPIDPFCEVPAKSGVPNSVFGYRASFRYYFNTTYGNCYTFYYYGVGGNDNIYDTEQDCRRRCDRTYEGYLKDAPTPAENPFCGEHQIYQSVTQKPFSNCKNETNFYYDKPMNECLPFEGCKNDRNRFFTKAVCEKNCKV